MNRYAAISKEIDVLQDMVSNLYRDLDLSEVETIRKNLLDIDTILYLKDIDGIEEELDG